MMTQKIQKILVVVGLATFVFAIAGCTFDVMAKSVPPQGTDEVDARVDGVDRPDAMPGGSSPDSGLPTSACTMNAWALGTWQHFPTGGPPDYTQMPPAWLDLTDTQGMVVVATQNADQDIVRIGLVITGTAAGGPILGTLIIDGAWVGVINDEANFGTPTMEEEIDANVYADDLVATSTLTVSIMIGDPSVPTTCQILTWTGPIDLLGLGN